MENKEISSVFKLVGQLMEVHGENKFKARSYGNAAFQIGKYPKPIRDLETEELASIPGIGKNLVPKLEELVHTGNMTYLQNWLEKTPEGVVELLSVKGLGPGKVRTIWKDMEVESIGELLYACNENRLVDLKGFGEKTQNQVRDAINFMMQHKHHFLYASVEPLISDIKAWIKERFPGASCSESGAALRRDPILERLEVLVTQDVTAFPDTSENKIDVEFESVNRDQFEAILIERSLGDEIRSEIATSKYATLVEAFKANEIDLPVPEMRNAPWALDWLKRYKNDDLIDDAALKGCLHNHSTYSDGIHELAVMAEFLKEAGYEYFGICDHSQTAVYANGLKPERIVAQHQEIDQLNKELKPFKILKGIESDILVNGSLDYEDAVLESFDFVVASVHSVLKMDESTATNRLIKAIEDPFTSILGHPTGRLLLSRPGYPIDHKKIIDACSANGVAIELNANPMRLDIDYRWIPYCMEKGVMVSINPDAHRIEGFDHMRYGVMSARKGGLTKEMTLNALSLIELERYFRS